MRKEEVAVNISSAAISSVSIYDDEVTRYRVRECRAFECKFDCTFVANADIFSLPRENLSLPLRKKRKSARQSNRAVSSLAKVYLTVKISRLDSQK